MPESFWYLDQNIINIALTSQQELETIVIIYEHVETEADS